MEHAWKADVTNDPSREFSLCIDISFNDEHRATIFRPPNGDLILRWYADEKDADVPVTWLANVFQKAEREI